MSIIADQIGYYRARAAEYDEWWFRTGRYDQGAEQNAAWFREVDEITRAVKSAGPSGNALEIACGTGLWTQHLAPHVDRLLALDAVDEVMELARNRVSAPHVQYLKADIFSWRPKERYDFIFFGFWISHIPRAHWDAFWNMLSDAISPAGTVFFIDNRRYAFRGVTTSERHLDGEDEIETRILNDGRDYTIVKNFFEPSALESELAQRGWVGEARETAKFFTYGRFQPRPGQDRASAGA